MTGLWSCPDCSFTFDAAHINEDGGHSCPACGEARALTALHQIRELTDLMLEKRGDSGERPDRLGLCDALDRWPDEFDGADRDRIAELAFKLDGIADRNVKGRRL